jgi:dephospho-CoA kinase
MYLVGLTGGIAAGKSTVAKRWVEHGAFAIDADEIAREVVEPETEGLNRIKQEFGAEVITESGTLDRQALASIVFGDAKKREILNSILHPLIRSRTKQLLEENSEHKIVVYSVPLLVEAAVDHDFDLVVTVEAPEDEQIRRLVTTRAMSDAEAKSRIDAQARPVERAARADRILNSNQDINLLLKDADSLWREIKSLASKTEGR